MHRQLAAAMKMPMGFKNGRSGARGLGTAGRFLMWRSGSKISEKSSGNDLSDTLLYILFEDFEKWGKSLGTINAVNVHFTLEKFDVSSCIVLDQSERRTKLTMSSFETWVLGAFTNSYEEKSHSKNVTRHGVSFKHWGKSTDLQYPSPQCFNGKFGGIL